jgi:hypothetical protein
VRACVRALAQCYNVAVGLRARIATRALVATEPHGTALPLALFA